MNDFNKSIILDRDHSDTLSLYAHGVTNGGYRPNDSWAIYISQRLLDGDTSRLTEVYFHEWMHLHLFTSTAFGYVQQVFASTIDKLKEGNTVAHWALSPLLKYHSALHETSWGVHEGAATIYPYLLSNKFSIGLVRGNTYEGLPLRYQNAATDFATCIGALMPVQLAAFGHIFANAVAQFCLNTQIINHAVDYWNGLYTYGPGKTYDIFTHLSNEKNSPQSRLYKLIGELYKDEQNQIPGSIFREFMKNIKTLDFVIVRDDGGVQFRLDDDEKVILINDLLNNVILHEIENLLPGWSNFFKVIDMEPDFRRLLAAVNSNDWGMIILWDSMTENLKRRASFKPIIKPLSA